MDSSEEFWFTGADPSRTVHGFLLRPHGYEKGKKYGLAFLVHGGPQSAWNSSWSTRWNLNAWTAQGYVVVAINPTGSTGYGQDFVDAINCNVRFIRQATFAISELIYVTEHRWEDLHSRTLYQA